MIHVRLLGGMDLRGADGRALDAALRQPKRLAVLVYLLCARPRGFHRRDKLAALFWPELPEERARAALRTTLTRLRDDLGDDVLRSRGADELAVDSELVRCDLLELEQRLARGDVMAAADLHTGPFLDGVHVEGVAEEFESWIAQERTRVVTELVGALRGASAGAQAAGDLAAARQLLGRARDLAPLDELVARELIALHLAAGDRGSALAAYERLRETLRREFGVSPSEQTTALVAPLSSPAAAAASTRPRQPRAADWASGEDRSVEPRTPSGGDRVATRRRGAVALLAVLVLAGALWQGGRRESAAGAAPAAWTSVRASDGTALQLTSPAVVLDSTEDALLIVHGAETFNPLRLNPRVMRLRGVAGDAATWTTVHAGGAPAPRPRYAAATAYDRAADRLFLFGGAFGTTSPCGDDLWALRPASGLSGPPQWRALETSGPRPGARANATLAYDAGRQRLILHGGNDCFTVHHTDTWVLALSDSARGEPRWSELRVDTAAGAPRRAPGGAVVVDAARDRLLLVAGFEEAVPANALWLLEGLDAAAGRPARWRRLACANAPPARLHASLAYDAARAEALLFGGFDLGRRYFDDVWRLVGLSGDAASCRWERVATGVPGPAARGGATARVSARSGALLVFGGFIGVSALNDVWRLEAAAARDAAAR